MSTGSEINANALLVSLTDGVSFEVPNVDLSGTQFAFPGDVTAAMYAVLTKLTNEDLTTGVDGTGTFDVLMKSFAAHLKVEYNANRITGAEYTKAFIALTESAMSGAVQFLLGRDQAFWAAQNAQIAAITARVGLETAKVQHAALQFQALTAEADYALTKLKLATEDAQYGTLKYQLDNTLPAQHGQVLQQTENLGIEGDISSYNLGTILPLQSTGLGLDNAGKTLQNQTGTYNLSTILPLQSDKLSLENEGQTTQNSIAGYQLGTIMPLQSTGLGLDNAGKTLQNQTGTYNLATILPLQAGKLTAETAGQTAQTTQTTYQTGNILPQQLNLLKEQTEAQRAQTLDTRVDGATVTGSVGKQKDLYDQQITSYQRSSETNAAKIFADAWITRKTIDEGLPAPTGFENVSIDTVLTAIKTNNNLA